MFAVSQLHGATWMGELSCDACFKRFSMHHNGFEVFDAYANMNSLLDGKFLKIQRVDSHAGLQGLLQYICSC